MRSPAPLGIGAREREVRSVEGDGYATSDRGPVSTTWWWNEPGVTVDALLSDITTRVLDSLMRIDRPGDRDTFEYPNHGHKTGDRIDGLFDDAKGENLTAVVVEIIDENTYVAEAIA